MYSETLKSVLDFLRSLDLSKWELFLVFVVVLAFWRLPTFLLHRREQLAARQDFLLRSEKAKSKIEVERQKRAYRLTKGK